MLCNGQVPTDGGIHRLYAAGCPHNIVQVLAGHAPQGLHDKGYVDLNQLPMQLLREGLEWLRYDEIEARLRSTSVTPL